MEQFEIAYNRALRFLSYRQRSVKEVRDNLAKKQFESDVIDQVIQKLLDQKFLNDAEFTRMWIESRNRSKPKAKRLLLFELRQKGIGEETVERMQHSGFRIQNDLSLAKKIVEKKMTKLKHLERNEIYKKLGGLLGRRGFDFGTIKRAIDDSMK